MKKRIVPDFKPKHELVAVEISIARINNMDYYYVAKANEFYSWLEAQGENGNTIIVHHEYDPCPTFDDGSLDTDYLPEYLKKWAEEFLEKQTERQLESV